ncbi:ATP-binding cassette domain-containing protein [uncultured Cardiobacterium sp.]|mgnify:CR=1 FL=1|uniref:ATP-binding cassette domain-containing protein n=1 Tax=uncultured Cardiobacterium sp. TaxID=417619 RepID=UPI0026099151|nr:ATP-binding cassette domain-containing protein [uncultured Cardiobacterium sp.]
MTAITIDHLSHRYGKTTALDNISLTLPRGATVGLIGPDGVGKSTLLGIIAGVRRIQSGQVRVLDGDMTRARDRLALSHRIAYMPQGLGRNLYPTLSVYENIDFHARLFGLERRERRARIQRLLDATGLAPFPDRAAGKLSGGMKQKVSLCCALVHSPDLLILDEPTTGVDPLSRRQFWALVHDLQQETTGMTTLVATAYIEEAEQFRQLLAMDAGKLLINAPTAATMRDYGCATLEETYIKLLPPEKQQGTGGLDPTPFVPDPHAPPAIEAHSLTKTFADFTAVDHVSFTIEKGEIFGFLGSNGCGKTTTMKMLTGLLQASSGSASLLGAPVDAGSVSTRMRVGYMSQAFSLYEELTVRQNLELHARLYRLGTGSKAAISEALTQYDLATVAEQKPAALPLGIRQRLQLAAACLHRPEVLILDEPTSGVDPAARDMFWRHLLRMSREDKITIFVSTHFMNEAARCDRISFMHQGRVLAVGSPAALTAQSGAPNLEEAFIAYLIADEKQQNPVNTSLGTPSTETVGWASAHQTNPADATPSSNSPEKPANTPLDGANPINTSLNATAPAADTGTIPSPACGGRRPEAGRGETAGPTTTPFDGTNPVNTPLNATAPAADTGTIPSPACGGRWPEAGRGETANSTTTPLDGANPANTSLDGVTPVNTSLGAPKTATLRYWFATTWTFARREGTELLRDHVRTFFALFGPIILMTAITWGVSFDIKNLTYAVLDHDHSAESRAIIEPLAGSRYFNELPPLSDESQLLDRLASREAKLTIDIPPNFGRDLLRERRPEIHYHIDGAESFNAANINAYIPAILAAYTREQARARGIALPPPAASLEPRYAYNQDFKSVNAIAPGVLMLALTLFPAMMAAVGVVREREIGSIANYYTSPASRLQYLVGKQLPYIATAMLSFAILYLMMRYWFGLPMKGSLAALTLATLLMSCTSTAIGLLFSTFTRSQVAAIFLTAIATIMPALNFSGFLVPVSALEGGAHIFGKIIPSTWYAVTTTGTFSKGLGVHELHREILLLALYYAVFLTAACLNLKKQEK